MKRKKVSVAASQAVHLAAVESNVLLAFSQVIAHCAVTRYDDGGPREPGWITVTTRGPNWRITVKDPDSAASFVVTAPSFDEALMMTCLLLDSEEAPWENDKWLQQGSKKKK